MTNSQNVNALLPDPDGKTITSSLCFPILPPVNYFSRPQSNKQTNKPQQQQQQQQKPNNNKLTSILPSSSMDSNTFPDYNNAVKLNLDHKKKLTSGELEVKYGNNPKDKSKRLAVSANVVKRIKNIKNVDLNYKLEAQAPELVSIKFFDIINPFTASCENAMTLSVPDIPASCEKFPHSSQLNF
jgi:hypothetical protein